MKTFAKWFVFCMINGDQQPNVLKAYGVEGYPTHLVTDQDGKELARNVGYGNPQMFYNWLSAQK